MPRQTIATHVAHMERVAACCAARSGDDPQDIATDILANLRLWCMARNLDFDRCLRRAEMHVAAELREECG